MAIDAPRVDPSPSEDAEGAEPASTNAGPAGPTGHPAHHPLLGAGLVIVENMTGLEGLPERFELRAYPLPIADGDGSPVRAVADW